MYLPPDAQIYLGNIHFFFFIIPLTYTLGSICLYRYEQIQSNERNQQQSSCYRCLYIYRVYVLFILTIILFILSSIGITISYRFSWFISPFGLPLIVFSIFLYIKTHRLTHGDFRLHLPNEEENLNFIPN